MGNAFTPYLPNIAVSSAAETFYNNLQMVAMLFCYSKIKHLRCYLICFTLPKKLLHLSTNVCVWGGGGIGYFQP